MKKKIQSLLWRNRIPISSWATTLAVHFVILVVAYSAPPRERAVLELREPRSESGPMVTTLPIVTAEKPLPLQTDVPEKFTPQEVPSEREKAVERPQKPAPETPKTKQTKQAKRSKKRTTEARAPKPSTTPKSPPQRVVTLSGVYTRGSVSDAVSDSTPLGEPATITGSTGREGAVGPASEDGSSEGGGTDGERIQARPKREKDRKAIPDAEYNRSIRADYPASARRQGLEGDVVAVLTVDEEGAVSAVRIVKSAGVEFDEAARRAFSRFRFKPAIRKGVKVVSKVRLVYRFRLSQV